MKIEQKKDLKEMTYNFEKFSQMSLPGLTSSAGEFSAISR
jgi:hypothetical protein